jgi:hypothetical protein
VEIDPIQVPEPAIDFYSGVEYLRWQYPEQGVNQGGGRFVHSVGIQIHNSGKFVQSTNIRVNLTPTEHIALGWFPRTEWDHNGFIPVNLILGNLQVF